jgi:hypothetical protein
VQLYGVQKNYRCKGHYIVVQVLVTEQTWSHAHEGNCSTYKMLWKWNWYIQNSSFYNTRKIMQHTASTLDALQWRTKWSSLLFLHYGITLSHLMYFVLPKSIGGKCFFEVIVYFCYWFL